MSRWRSGSSWLLLASGLGLVVATPAVVKAFGVESWRWLTASAAIAASVAGPLAKVLGDKFGRRNQRREEQQQALDSAALGRGQLRVRDVDDPTILGVHPAKLPVGLSADDLPEGSASRFPVYVPRDRHTDVVSQLGPGSFVLLVGDSTAGKTRLAYQAMLAALPSHYVVVPDSRSTLALSVTAAVEKSASVLWLDDLERFLGVDGLTVSMIERMREGRNHRVIIATIRREELNLLQEPGEERDLGNEVRRVLEQAHYVTVERMLSPGEWKKANKLIWDPRIADAIAHVDEYGLAEYMAAGPELLARWENGWAPGTHPRGSALVEAAIDCCRAGWKGLLPAGLLETVHESYLEVRGGNRLRPEPLDAAWGWVTRPLFATTALLEQRAEKAVHVADYLVDHVQRIRTPDEHVPDHVVHATIDVADGATADDIGRAMLANGRLPLADAAFVKATDLRRTELGSEHPDTLISWGNLAEVLPVRGDLAEAEAEQQAVSAAMTRVLGPEHPRTLASRGNLALVRWSRGDLDGAEAENRAVLEACTRVLGAEHPDTLISRNNLALVFRERGDLAAAEAEHRAVLEAMRRVLGAKHPDTLTAHSNLGEVLLALGDLDGAEAVHRAVLEARTRVEGADHPSTLSSRHFLALVLRKRGDLDGEEAERRAVLEVCIRVFGQEHPRTVISRNNLAAVLQARADLAI